MVVLSVFYGLLTFVMSQKPSFRSENAPKPQPKTIETALHRVGGDENWRFKMEEDNRKLSEHISALEKLFHEGIKDKAQNEPSPESLQALEEKVSHLESALEQRTQDLSPSPHPTGETRGTETHERSLQKFSLTLSETPHSKRLKTVDTTIPAGAFAKTILLSGLDASSAMNASSDPRPLLLRLVDYGTLPRQFQSDLKDCHCLASAYGDLSSERIYARLEKLTCVERRSGEIIETQVAGYIAGPDGKAGIRGIVVSKDGQFLARSLMGGLFSGLSNVANPQNRQTQSSPFLGTNVLPGTKNPSPPSIGETFASGMASGATTALDRLSQYYIDRAEQLQPIIQVSAGQGVDIVFTEGTGIGATNVKEEIESQRTGRTDTSETRDQ